MATPSNSKKMDTKKIVPVKLFWFYWYFNIQFSREILNEISSWFFFSMKFFFFLIFALQSYSRIKFNCLIEAMNMKLVKFFWGKISTFANSLSLGPCLFGTCFVNKRKSFSHHKNADLKEKRLVAEITFLELMSILR